MGSLTPVAPMLCGWATPPDDAAGFDKAMARYLRGYKPDGSTHAFEIKWDGYRLQAIKSGESVRVLFGRTANDVTAQFPEFVEAVRRIPVDCILDGEAVVLRDGWPNFNDFQNRMGLSPERRARDLRFVVFDVLQFGATDAKSATYTQRREALKALVAPAAPTVWVGPSSTDGPKMWQFVLDHNLEGLIAKPLGSRYLAGERGTWTKIKRTLTETFTVIGYSAATTGKRAGWFGALFVADEMPDGTLRPCGAVGTGYNDDVLDDLYKQLQPLRRPTRDPRVTKDLREDGLVWVEPQLRITAAFQERTDGIVLRGPASFKGQVR